MDKEKNMGMSDEQLKTFLKAICMSALRDSCELSPRKCKKIMRKMQKEEKRKQRVD